MNAGDEKTSEKKKKLQYRLGLVFLGLCVFWLITTLTETDLLAVGTEAPKWSLVRAGENRAKLALGDLKGKVVVLDFWSISCPPCVREVTELQAISQRFGERDVAVVGVAAWGETMAELREFKKQRKLGYRLLVGEDRTVAAYKATTLPTLYIIDQDGVIVTAHQGFMPRGDIVEVIQQLLDKP